MEHTTDAYIIDQLDNFILYLKTNNYSPKTIYNYQQDLLIFNHFLNSSNLGIKDLDKRKVFEFKAYLSSNNRYTAANLQKTTKRLSSSSVNRSLSAVRTYIKFLLDQDYLCPVRPDQFTMVKREKNHPHVAEFNELISLIEAPSVLESDPIISARNRAILEVLFATGMRISELISLNRRDINNTGKIFITGKGRKQRFIYLTKRAQLYLEEYLSSRNDVQQALFIPTKGRNIKSSQRRLTDRYVQNKIQKYREKLRINIPITPHSLRHGFATYLAEEGASPVAIQILLGHESLNTTTRYVNASDKFAEETHRRMHPLSEPDIDKHPS